MAEGYYDEKTGMWVTVCRPGRALGADDLTTWSHRRALGFSGIPERRKRAQRKRKKERRERKGKPPKAALPKGTIVLDDAESKPCPRCERLMQVRAHVAITEKQLRKPYYFSRWYCCVNNNCRTTLVMPEEFKVLNLG